MTIYNSERHEVSSLPENVVLLVRVVGADRIQKIDRILHEIELPYFLAAFSETDVKYYVPKEHHTAITAIIESNLIASPLLQFTNRYMQEKAVFALNVLKKESVENYVLMIFQILH